MRQAARIVGMTLVCLVMLDIFVAGLLALEIRALAPLERYFALGRSVPGKLERWQDESLRDNLFNAGWISDAVARSSEAFAREDRSAGPVVRGYGMSFSDNILGAAARLDPTLRTDLVAGPAAPPNWTYAAFLDDRANRRPGDVVVLAFLSSSVAATQALSNRTWAFEQPAPMTYPIFRPQDDGGLQRIDPLIADPESERALASDAQKAAAWRDQLRREDALYRPEAFLAPELDVSPFFRLARRALASAAIDIAKTRVLEDKALWEQTLTRMVAEFLRITRSDGQIPVVLLIQTQASEQADLWGALQDTLVDANAAYLATVTVAHPRNSADFLPDGHFIPSIDRALAARFLALPHVVNALKAP